MSFIKLFSTLTVAGLISVSAGVAISIAADPAAVISQKGRKFSPSEVTVKKGSTVRFVNDDFYGHNVYSESGNSNFDIGLQPPGEERDVVLEELGIVDVRCRIHPRMRLQITVTD